MIKIFKKHLTNNKCYKCGNKFTPKGIMLHSTACPGVSANSFVKSWNVEKPNGRLVCVHGFIDLSGVYETLPFDVKGWHAGGKANDELLGFEICEPKDYADKEYFEEIKKVALEYTAIVCKLFQWTEKDITSHCEAHKKKGSVYASGHADLDHWWLKYHNYSMDNFRSDLKKILNNEVEDMENRYKDIKDIPAWARPTIDKLIEKGLLKGKDNGEIDLSLDMLRILVINDNAKLYD